MSGSPSTGLTMAMAPDVARLFAKDRVQLFHGSLYENGVAPKPGAVRCRACTSVRSP